MHTKARSFTDEQFLEMGPLELKRLSRESIRSLSAKQCALLKPEQLECFTREQLSFFSLAQRKCPVINIATKSITDVQKLNLNALSDIELKSLLRHQIRSLTYNQVVDMLPYVIWKNEIIGVGTIGNFRPVQYSFFKRQQLSWLTMYQSANIPRRYLSAMQIKYLPPPCYEFPRDTFRHFFHRDVVADIDCANLTSADVKYMSLYTISCFSKKQILLFPIKLFTADKRLYLKILYLQYAATSARK